MNEMERRLFEKTGETAREIYGYEINEEIFSLDLNYYLTMQNLARKGGFDLVRRHFANITEEFIDTLLSLNQAEIAQYLCNGSVSSICPSCSAHDLLSKARMRLHPEESVTASHKALVRSLKLRAEGNQKLRVVETIRGTNRAAN